MQQAVPHSNPNARGAPHLLAPFGALNALDRLSGKRWQPGLRALQRPPVWRSLAARLLRDGRNVRSGEMQSNAQKMKGRAAAALFATAAAVPPRTAGAAQQMPELVPDWWPSAGFLVSPAASRVSGTFCGGFDFCSTGNQRCTALFAFCAPLPPGPRRRCRRLVTLDREYPSLPAPG